MKPLLKALIYLFSIGSGTLSGSTWIVIHGTWAAGSTWYRPGGDFFDELCKNAHSFGMHVVPFTWSGNNSDEQRAVAARNLAHLIISYPPETQIVCVAHSHGVNVVMLASQYLGRHSKREHMIEAVYAFGCPVRQTDYFPAMSAIHYMYNFFSFEDLVQPIGGASAREFYGFDRVANIRVTVNGKQPGHSGLHDPLIARWLPFLHRELNALLGDAQMAKLFFSQASLLHFTGDGTQPWYECDGEREHLHARDVALNQMLMQAFFRVTNKVYFIR